MNGDYHFLLRRSTKGWEKKKIFSASAVYAEGLIRVAGGDLLSKKRGARLRVKLVKGKKKRQTCSRE